MINQYYGVLGSANASKCPSFLKPVALFYEKLSVRYGHFYKGTTASFYNLNHMGYYICICSSMFVGMFFNENKMSKKIALCFLVALSFWTLILNDTLGVFIAVFVSVLIFTFVMIFVRKTKVRVAIIPLVIFALVNVLCVSFPFEEKSIIEKNITETISDVKKVTSTVGAEQEYFLIDKNLYQKRKDLIFCNRTLFGAKPPKGQELEDHYYGAIKPRIVNFMKDLDEQLWKLGIPSKTKHNEVAPCQHEMAPVFTTTNLAADQNQLTMEIMKKVAQEHDMICILHEKPFDGLNGSGKHNNWSISTDTGENLLEPGNTPEDNTQFLLVLTAIIKAVDEHQDLLRLSVASRGNDLRLGGDEAPPAIISIFLGDELTAILESIMTGKPYDKKAKEVMKLGVYSLPAFPKDNTDRNRTSPFAFTGNKFEFRSLGSSQSISCSNTMINTIVAEEFCQFADILEKSTDFNKDMNNLIKKTLKKHSRIIFNGNGYSDEWVQEAEKRGLLNLKTTIDAMPYYLAQKNIDIFQKRIY